MVSTVDKNFITKKHNQLLRIALFSRIFAWIALIFQILYTVLMFFELQIPYLTHLISSGSTSDLTIALKSLIDYLILPNVGLLVLLIKGITYYLVLNGISAGLNMIVETDLNYREMSIEANNGN
jgi:hypothetical protein